MRVLVTGSSGHLGKALIHAMRQRGRHYEVIGIDLRPGSYTDVIGDISDASFVAHLISNPKQQNSDDDDDDDDDCNTGNGSIQAIIHTATLHKPHLETHSRQQFFDTNVTGTFNLLQEAVKHRMKAFVFSSTTSLFGDAMKSLKGSPAVSMTEQVVPRPNDNYGVTKMAAEQLCRSMHRLHQLPVVVLRTSRFFSGVDNQREQRFRFPIDANLKTNEFLYRRVDLSDVVDAYLLALSRAGDIGFDTFIISATSPFQKSDLEELGANGPAVVARIYPQYPAIYEKLGWRMMESFDRVYVNAHARERLGWLPRYDFAYRLQCLASEVSSTSC